MELKCKKYFILLKIVNKIYCEKHIYFEYFKLFLIFNQIFNERKIRGKKIK